MRMFGLVFLLAIGSRVLVTCPSCKSIGQFGFVTTTRTGSIIAYDKDTKRQVIKFDGDGIIKDFPSSMLKKIK